MLVGLAGIGTNKKASINGGLFKIGEGNLRTQMQQFIDQFGTAFLYLYLPTGDGWGNEYGFNQSPKLDGIPTNVLNKIQKARTTFWDWGMPTGLHAESDIINAITAAITKNWYEPLSILE